jgi:NitT/TauT family transport system ATP-binding protein
VTSAAVDERAADARPAPLLRVQRVKLGYDVGRERHIAVEDVSFDVEQGEKIMLLGPSGCGKSTLLKTVAGFLTPYAGRVDLAGRSSLKPGPDRAVVFQEFDQLLPWRTVRGNLVYPQHVNGVSKAEASRRADEYLEVMSLTAAADRYPHQLSGGMKQRVAIARALALDPVMLLMDEPFGALDAQTRSRLQGELKQLAARTAVTVLFVTHSIQEAVFVGDRVVVLSSPPSRVADVVDVRALDDPGSAQFGAVSTHLRSMLAGPDESRAHATFE